MEHSNGQTYKNNSQLIKGMIVLRAMVIRNVKNQYRRSVLGILWTILNPLLTMLVMAWVFSEVFGRGNINMDYPVFVLSGYIVFNFMSTATKMALPSMVNNYNLFTKAKVPLVVFPLADVCTALVNFGFSLIALVLIMIIRLSAGVEFHFTLLMIVVPWLPAMFMFSLGLALILCSIYVRFRDIRHIYSVVLRLWMYLTPIFYSLSTLKNPSVQSILDFNPMVHYVNYFRELIIGNVPGLKENLIIYGTGIVMLLLGILLFKSQKKKFIIYN